jgi:hypothetical protein
MILEFLTSRFFFIIPMIVGGMMFWYLLILMSKSIGVSWKDDVWSKIKEDPEALAHYFGMRAVAVAIAVGLFAIAGAIA